MTRRFPVAKPCLGELEEKYVLDAVRSGWVSSHGPYLRRFEEDFAARCGVPAAVATANGTVALHLALAAAGIGPGDEVVVPALTYVASANAVTYCGATPVFVDVSPATWCVDVAQVAAAVGPRTRAVLAVDLYGHPADYAALRRLCDRHGLLLVADAAESFGASVAGRPVGELADVSTFSFFGNKIITAGEGGCVTTARADLAERMRLLRNQGMDPRRRYHFLEVGFNYRMTNVAAALLCAQMERSGQILGRREEILQRYDEGLAGALEPQPVAPGVRRAPWMASFLVPAGAPVGQRDRLGAALDRLGVETRPFFSPIPGLPPYAGAPRRPHPVATDLGRRGLNLPTYGDLTNSDVDEVVSRVRRALGSLGSPAEAPAAGRSSRV
ncbi:DegT/DnrJ/EryC1/StrS family aminotransferase [Phytohabitans sp. ZYX-F-186]|uniref:DegT/DnrJ/EryC1/StrS family aminotransferase n=1 Tax=Phytohabitans maris TaxID=3071409 RepID=A0ABU0ZMM4_9ACTN|nr:DegT/DnrJ/EryC1/StrS family aminotransferase [Phytohabitans sp. ZYX-F-186]MDQ7908213.1 DegT/DnrJ/EryC1/StrS family aminotransferase [Phytohabitans sp. ZYX-F-186]